MSTPVAITTTSRGVVPHLTPDHVKYLFENNSISGLSFPAEDFLDKLPEVSNIPFLGYTATQGRQIKDLLVMPEDPLRIITARRSVPVKSPKPNTKDSISIMTSEGFRYMPLSVYLLFSSRFGADMVVSPADIPNLSPGGKPGGNRSRNMIQRSTKWLEDLIGSRNAEHGDFAIVASILPTLSLEQQKGYLDFILEKKNDLVGISFQGSRSIGRLAEKDNSNMDLVDEPTQELSFINEFVNSIEDQTLIRVFSSGATSPQQVLDLVSRGIDVVYADYVNEFSDYGIALDYEFPVRSGSEQLQAFSYSMWDSENATSMTSLGRINSTYYGEKYKRAYVHHLLQAHEMTAWVVLQLHNQEVNARFMQGIRNSIDKGTFEEDMKRFFEVYGDEQTVQMVKSNAKKQEKELLPKTRGYNVSYEQEKVLKEQGSSAKLNDPAYRKL